MAQFKTDFSEYTADAQPVDWTERWNDGDGAALVRTGSGATDIGAQYLELTKTADSRYLLSWDDLDADADRADSEVLMRFQTDNVSTSSDFVLAAVVRGAGAAGSEDGYALFLEEDDRLLLYRYSAGAVTQVGDYQFHAQFPDDITANEYVWIRFRVNGSALQAKIWRELGQEPEAWQIDTTNGDITAAGWVGVAAHDSVGTRKLDFLSVGTNGDTAEYPDVDPTNTGRVTQVFTEALHDSPQATTPEGRVTQVFTEALTDLPESDPDPVGRVTRVFVEVLRDAPGAGGGGTRGYIFIAT